MIYSKKNITILLIVYLLLGLLFYGLAYEQIIYSDITYDIEESESTVGELNEGDILEQKIFFDGVDYVHKLGVKIGTYGRLNEGRLVLSLVDSNDKTISKRSFKAAKLADNGLIDLPIRTKIKDGEYILKIEAVGSAPGYGVTVYSVDDNKYDDCIFNGKEIKGRIAFRYSGGAVRTNFLTYALIVLAGGVVLFIILILLNRRESAGKTVGLTSLIRNVTKYRFLIKQLVNRDFKTKYKRSVLGICWSLLQPVLMMTVQFFVFSTLFRSNIDFYPVYLLSGSVMFSFFTDSVGAGLLSIVGNGGLITKVYVPKYIYPVTKVLSTTVNLVLSLIPLMLVMIVTGAPFTKAIFLVFYVFICLLVFCVGMSFLLSTSMVFFRDTQFIWSILALVWMYGTPLFYPESIIPSQFRVILSANPMYHYIKFFRCLLIEGVSPGLSEYVICAAFSAVVLMLGVFVFKKTQNKFILYI